MIDNIDKKILKELQANGRISNVELSDRVNLSQAACLQRVKRLKEKNYILGFSAQLNPCLLESSLLVFVAIKLDSSTVSRIRDFNRQILSLPEIQECHFLNGGFDYLLKARAKNIQFYRERVLLPILSMECVREAQTFSVMEEIKSTGLISIF